MSAHHLIARVIGLAAAWVVFGAVLAPQPVKADWAKIIYVVKGSAQEPAKGWRYDYPGICGKMHADVYVRVYLK